MLCVDIRNVLSARCECCFFFKQTTAYEMRISDWSSDVCSSDLAATEGNLTRLGDLLREVRRQLRPLERQADAARRHGDLVSELRTLQLFQIGRASCRESVCQYV